jgi:hypothetical protein
MSINDFLEKENLELLWEVLIDEPLIKQLCDSVIKFKTLIHIFQSNLNEFFMAEKNNCNNLIELNKKYILLIINYVIKTNNNNQPVIPSQNQYTTNQYKKIKIHQDEPVKQSITFEDIQNDRLNFFEKELNKKQEEFTNAMTLPVPPVPNFTDKLDEPMSEIELEIKRIQEQRNYDIEMINNTNKNINTSSDQNWLKAQETSIKNEKLVKINNIVAAQNNGTNINNNSNNNKHITWEDEMQPVQESMYEKKEESEETNIFGKLKKITSSNNNNTLVPNYQLQIDDLKKEISSLSEKLDIILQKLQ